VNDLIERIRHICVKGGVKETVMGEICLAVREELAASADVQGEYICKCGVRVEPHRCATGTEF
jgi:hypothetical protein